MARPLIARGAFALMMATVFLLGFAPPLARMGATYQALALGRPELAGVLAAAFAALPMLLVVQFGRMTDRRGVRPAILCGAAMVLAAMLFLTLAPPHAGWLIAGMALLGVGQTMAYTGMQMTSVLVASRAHRDSALGNYLLAMTLGGALAPLLIGWAGEGNARIARSLFAFGAVAAGLLMLAALALCLRLRREHLRPKDVPPVMTVLRRPGMAAILIAGALCANAQDLLGTFLPLLGEARGWAPAQVGQMLAGMAMASVLARAVYGPMVRRLGRFRMAGGLSLISALVLAGLALPLPLAANFAILALAGFCLGGAGAASISVVMTGAPRGSGGTAMALRQLSSRIGLFALPMAAGALGAAAGVIGIFGLIAASMAGAAGLTALSARQSDRS